jgi:DNA invertase Pin-like site-specific DNA recombinase
VDRGISGSKDKRPALDALLKDAKRRKFDVLVCWRLDRLGRNFRRLIVTIDELSALGIGFVSLGDCIDTSAPAGRLQLHVLAAIAEFERARLRERVVAGLASARAQGVRLGRPRRHIDRATIKRVTLQSHDDEMSCISRITGSSDSAIRTSEAEASSQPPSSPTLLMRTCFRGFEQSASLRTTHSM